MSEDVCALFAVEIRCDSTNNFLKNTPDVEFCGAAMIENVELTRIKLCKLGPDHILSTGSGIENVDWVRITFCLKVENVGSTSITDATVKRTREQLTRSTPSRK